VGSSSAETVVSDAWARFGAAGALLARVARGGRTAPAYIFESEDRDGPRAAAKTFAAALLCREPRRPCGACSTCRRIASGNHPDVHARGRDKATVISVEALVELLERAHGSPIEGDRQVFVIDPADALAPEAVAMYLKSLEEPPPTTTFVLVTSRPDRLPTTVRSRCQRFRFPGPDEGVIASRLVRDGADPERAAVLAHWSSGSSARARRLLALAADEAIDELVRASSGRTSTAATSVESVLADLRTRAGVALEPEQAEPEAQESATPPGEALRRALEDVLHALVTVARDRTAGRAGGPLAGLPPDAAARALPALGALAVEIRRNVSPAALLIEAVRVMRRP
jgi:DNA polymerase-3 subunit delta'